FITKMKEKPSIFTTKQQLTKGDSRKKTFLMKFFPARETSLPCVEKNNLPRREITDLRSNS
ncbi:hypothetical protein, partial [Porphyromonas loveana]